MTFPKSCVFVNRWRGGGGRRPEEAMPQSASRFAGFRGPSPRPFPTAEILNQPEHMVGEGERLSPQITIKRRSHALASTVGILVVSMTLLFPHVAVFAADNPFAAQYVQSLKQAGVEINAQGLGDFLRLHHPGSDQEKIYRELVAQMGDADFFKREDAMLRLLRAPVHTAGVLAAAAEDPDPEIRWRAKVVLEETSQPRNDLLYAAFVVVNDQRIPGLADAVLGTLPLCRSDHVRLALTRALESTVTPDDAELLRKTLASERPEARVVAATAIRRCLGDEADVDLLPLLDDQDDTVRVMAAEILLPRQKEKSLSNLAALLTSKSLSVRNRSIQLLRSGTKIDLPFSGYEPEEDRAKHAAAWQAAIVEFLKK